MYGPPMSRRGPGIAPASIIRLSSTSWSGSWLPAVIAVVTPIARYGYAPAFICTVCRTPPK
jgi:hypothetical protein